MRDDFDISTSVRPTAAVIGTGFGGLAAAVRLLARGYRVTMFEALDQPGGRARVFRDQGFVYDAGPTIITVPFIFDDLWAALGERREDHVDFRSLSPFYGIRFDSGHVFNYSGDRDAMRAEIAAVCPADVDGYDRFLAYSQRIYKIGFEQLCHQPIDSWTRMASIVPDLMRLGFHRSVYGAASRYFSHPDIRKVFSFHPLLIGGNPFQTTAIFSMIAYLEAAHGVHFAMGGTGALVRGLADLITRHGGHISYNSPVEDICVDSGPDGERATGVRLQSGEVFSADIVVSNADAATTYSRLLPVQTPKRWTPAKVKRQDFSMSLFVWYFGTNRTYDDVQHHMILLGPRYKALLADIFKHKVLADDFSLYLHRPTATDPSLAPDGCDSFYVLSPVPNTLSGIDWHTEAETYRARIEDYLAATVLPDLGKHIVSSHMITPYTFETDLRSMHGAGFSFAPKLMQSAWFRPHNRSETIKGLYLVGAGTHPGAGLPGVVSSARVLDGLLEHAAPAAV